MIYVGPGSPLKWEADWTPGSGGWVEGAGGTKWGKGRNCHLAWPRESLAAKKLLEEYGLWIPRLLQSVEAGRPKPRSSSRDRLGSGLHRQSV